MNIAFVLPCSGRYPIGGFRIVYEYANRLAERGHNVTLYHATNATFSQLAVKAKLINIALWLRNKMTGLYLPTKWFFLAPDIKTRCCLGVSVPRAHKFDAIVATAWQTAWPVSKLASQRKYYFIQHFEDWDAEAQQVLGSWKLPLAKIVISRWLKQLVESQGEVCRVVPNAIDCQFFYPTMPIETRDPSTILIQLHNKNWKGSEDALAAIQILRQRHKTFRLRLFGIPDHRGFTISGPFTYCQNPSQDVLRNLYSQSAIFVAASWSEGWGLTPHEASACGAAIVATDIDGHQEFLTNNVSALLSPPRNPEALANHIEKLLDNQQLRISLARTGLESARRFSWEKAVPAFETILADEQDATA